MESRPKRSSRNQNPSYTFQKDTDFVVQDLAIAPVPKKRQRRCSKLSGDFDESQATSPTTVKLTEERKNDILALLKKDMRQQGTVAQVGSAKHIRKIAGEVGAPLEQLRKWLGITDDLTQVNVSSSSQFKQKKLVPMAYDAEPSKDTAQQLDEEGENLGGKLHELEETFQEEKPLLEEELVKLQEEIQHATELIEQVEEKQRLMESDLSPIEDNLPELEGTSVVAAHGSDLIDEERFELAQADYMMGTEMPNIWNQTQIEAAAPVNDLENEWVQDMWDTFMKSENGMQLASSQSSEWDENNDVFEDAFGEMEEMEQQQNEDGCVMDFKEVATPQQVVGFSLASPSGFHQSTGSDLETTDLAASLPNPESEPSFDVSTSTAGVIGENMQAEEAETVQPNHSTCSAENVERKSEKKKERKSKITDYFKKLSRGKKEE